MPDQIHTLYDNALQLFTHHVTKEQILQQDGQIVRLEVTRSGTTVNGIEITREMAEGGAINGQLLIDSGINVPILYNHDMFGKTGGTILNFYTQS